MTMVASTGPPYGATSPVTCSSWDYAGGVRPYRALLLSAIGMLVVASAAWADLSIPVHPIVSGMIGRPAKGKLRSRAARSPTPTSAKPSSSSWHTRKKAVRWGSSSTARRPFRSRSTCRQFGALGSRGDQVWLGGPVLPTSLVLQKAAKPHSDAESVFQDVYVLTSRAAVERLLGSKKQAGRFRAYAGHTGWGPGQLQNEIERGDWLVVPAKPEVVFSEKPAEVWEGLMERSRASGPAARETARSR